MGTVEGDRYIYTYPRTETFTKKAFSKVVRQIKKHN